MDDIVTGDIGGRLRRARQERGLSLHDAAQRTKLSIHVLRAIERNDFASLPGGLYRKAYLRSLAGEVGLDPHAIAADYDKAFEPATDPAAGAGRDAVREDEWLRQLTPSPRRSMVTFAVLVGLATAWFAWPDGVEPVLPAATGPGELIPARAPLDTAAPAMHKASQLAQGAATRSPIDVPLRIEMEAVSWCWVAAESDGARVIYRLVEPGERVVLEGRRRISLRLGDAGAVVLSINGGARRSPGRDGDVVELEVTEGNLEELRDVAAAVPHTTRRLSTETAPSA